MSTIGFIGAGNMAEAIIKGILTAGIHQSNEIMISDVKEQRLADLKDLYNINSCSDNNELAKQADIVVLSIKPQTMAEALDGVGAAITDDKLVISIMAGKTVTDISEILGDAAIVRVMPNTPALIAAGAAGLYSNEKAKDKLALAVEIFSSVGKVVVVADEGLIDAVTAVSGSGPAYFFLMMEKIIDAAVELGLTEENAAELVLQTAKGAALLADEANQSGEKPDSLREKVTSPGGTTAAALKVFEDENFAGIIHKALTAARDRSVELSTMR